MYENRKISSISIILVIAIILSLIGNIYLYVETNGLTESRDNLSNILRTTEENFDSLNATYLSYVETHTYSNSEFDSLQIEHQTYQSSHSVTNSEHQELQSNYDNYISDHSYTDAEYANLQNTYDAYLSTHIYSNSEYNQLDEDYDELSTYQSTLLEYVNRPLENKLTPTNSQFANWLNTDNTNTLPYNSDFDCKDFSMVLAIRARSQHWEMGVIAVTGTNTETDEYFGHAFNFIVTTEGVCYVDPQTDDFWWIFYEDDPTEEHIYMSEESTLHIPYGGPLIKIDTIEIVVDVN